MADALLVSGLDELILSFRSAAPTFYENYCNARAVVNRATTRDTVEPDVTAVPAGQGGVRDGKVKKIRR